MKIHKADVFKWIETIFSIYLTRIKTKKHASRDMLLV